MPTTKNFKSNRTRRHEEALARQEERAGRGDAGQLLRLESRGFAECAEAKALRKKLSGGEPIPPVEAPDKE